MKGGRRAADTRSSERDKERRPAHSSRPTRGEAVVNAGYRLGRATGKLLGAAREKTGKAQ